MTAKLAVTETGTRRFVERWAPFSISVNVAVLFQPFASMELGRSDREQESLITPCGHSCGDLCPCLEKVDKRGTLSALFEAIWQNTSQNRSKMWAIRKGADRGDKRGSKCVQVKGQVAFVSPLARKAPPGKAVREKKMPPRDTGYCKIGWHKKGILRKQGIRVGGMDVSRKK